MFFAQLSASLLYWTTWLWAWCYIRVFRPWIPLVFGYRIRGGDKTVSTSYLHSIIRNSLQQESTTPIDTSKLPMIESASINRGEIRAGLTGDMFKISIKWSESNDSSISLPTSVVVKANMPSLRAIHSCILLGSAREAYFYAQQSNEIKGSDSFDFVPVAFTSSASWITGDFSIVLRDLSQECYPCGPLLGNQCWGPVDIPAGLEQRPEVIVGTIFNRVAVLHGKYWRDRSLLKHKWLKNSDWVQGRDRARWELAMQGLVKKWRIIGPDPATLRSANGVVWSAKVVKAMNLFVNGTSWESFLRCVDLNGAGSIWTLTHGDFHAGNVLWTRNPAQGKTPFYLVDWSEVGIGDPFTELAQFVVSNLTIDARRKHERKLFQDYYNILVSQPRVDKSVCTEEIGWQHYKLGGLERWLQMLIILAMLNVNSPTGFPAKFVQWFHDQTSAFVDDHFESCNLPFVFRSVYCLS